MPRRWTEGVTSRPAAARPGEPRTRAFGRENVVGGAVRRSSGSRFFQETRAMLKTTNLDATCINTIRTLSMDAVQAANSGHPGTPMALAPVAYCLWQQFLRFDPQDPIWPNRDRFVLSAGHASMLLYSLLHLTGVRAVSKD